MPKKFFDILPPKKIKIETKTEEKEKKVNFQKTKQKIFPFIIKKLIFVFLIFVLFFGLYYRFLSVKIEIWPKTEVLTYKTKIEATDKIEEIKLETKVIPGKIFKIEKTITGEFPATGEIVKSEKATGTIRVYNDSQITQVLVANTRFQPPLEKFQPPLEEKENPWFRSLEKITIPPKSYVDVKVIAENPGEKYNIEPTTFSIPGLRGTPQYTFVYGKSFEPMKGGLLKKIAQVKTEDLEKAKNEISKRVIEETKSSLKKEISPEYYFFEEAIRSEILETLPLAKAGMETEKFNYQAKGSSQTIIFKKEDLRNFIVQFINSQLPPEKKLKEKNLKINLYFESLNLEAGKITFSVDIEAEVYPEIDFLVLKKKLSGKTLKESKNILEQSPQIARSEIKVFPFWLKRVPENFNKIHIKLIVD